MTWLKGPCRLREIGQLIGLVAGPSEPLMPDWHRDIVGERLADDERDPEGALSGEELIAWLRQPRS